MTHIQPQPYAQRHFRRLLILIVILGALLRLVDFDSGLPVKNYYHSMDEDEKYYVMVVGNMDLFRLDMDPNFYVHGPLLAYLFETGLSVGRVLGLTNHVIHEDYFAKYPEDYRKVMLIGRAVSFVLGILFLIMVGLEFRKLFGADTALLAVGFLAVATEPVIHSHVIRHDLPTAFFLTWMVARAYRMITPGRMLDYFLVAIPFALAVLSIYIAGAWLGLVVFFVAHFQSLQRKNRLKLKYFVDKNLLVGLIVTAELFLLLAPFALYKTKEFLTLLMVLPSIRELDLWNITRLTHGPRGFVYLLTTVLPHALGYLFFGFGLIALVYGWAKRRKEWLLLLIIPTLHIASLAILTHKFTRHAMFLVGPLAVLTARFLLYDFQDWLKAKTGSKARPILTGIIALVLLGSLAQTLATSLLFQKHDAPAEVTKYILENIPEGSVVAINGANSFSLFPPLNNRFYPDLQPRYQIVDHIDHDMKKLNSSQADYLIDWHPVIYGLHDKYIEEPGLEKQKAFINWLDSGQAYQKVATIENDLGALKFFYDVRRLPIDMHRVNMQVDIFKKVR